MLCAWHVSLTEVYVGRATGSDGHLVARRAKAKLEQIPDCTQYLIEYSICTSVVLDILQQITHTKSTPQLAWYLRVGLCHTAGRLGRRAYRVRPSS